MSSGTWFVACIILSVRTLQYFHFAVKLGLIREVLQRFHTNVTHGSSNYVVMGSKSLGFLQEFED